MAFVTINEKVCKGCGLCVFSCPKKVLELSEHKLNANGYPVAEAVRMGGLASAARSARRCAPIAPSRWINRRYDFKNKRRIHG